MEFMKIVAESNNILIAKEFQESNKIEYSNSLGVIFSNSVLIPSYNTRNPIEISIIKKCKIYKKESLLSKYFFVIVCLLTSILGVYFSTTYLEIVLLAVITGLSVLGFFKIKHTKYTLVLVKKDLDFIKIDLNLKEKDEAKKLVQIIEKKKRDEK